MANETGRPLPGPQNLNEWRQTKSRLFSSDEWTDVLQSITDANNAAIQKSMLTTRGDIITRSATEPQRVGLGATDTIVSSDGTDTVFRTKAQLNIASLNTEDQTLAGGARVTVKDLGTVSSGTVTPDPGDRPMQKYTNNGAHTLAPGTNVGAYLLTITNGASAGAITTSGWDLVTGDSFTTTNGHKFRCHCSIDDDGGQLLIITAMQ